MTSALPTFGICAPSSYGRRDWFDPGVQKLRDLGHTLVIHPQSYGRLGETQLAGTVDEKIAAIYDLMDDPAVDMIMAACGGNGAGHLLDKLDYTRLTKPMIGFSDTTSLLNAAYQKTRIVQYHGPHVNSFRDDVYNQNTYTQMLSVFNGSATTLPLRLAHIQTPGHATGHLIGGNFSAFHHILNTPYCPPLDGAILFFEDAGEELNHFDRTLNYFRLLGLFDRAAGIIFGQFTNMKDTGRPFGFTVDDIIATHTAGANVPVITHAAFGHDEHIPTFPVGASVTLDANGTAPTLTLDQKNKNR